MSTAPYLPEAINSAARRVMCLNCLGLISRRFCEDFRRISRLETFESDGHKAVINSCRDSLSRARQRIDQKQEAYHDADYDEAAKDVIRRFEAELDNVDSFIRLLEEIPQKELERRDLGRRWFKEKFAASGKDLVGNFERLESDCSRQIFSGNVAFFRKFSIVNKILGAISLVFSLLIFITSIVLLAKGGPRENLPELILCSLVLTGMGISGLLLSFRAIPNVDRPWFDPFFIVSMVALATFSLLGLVLFFVLSLHLQT